MCNLLILQVGFCVFFLMYQNPNVFPILDLMGTMINFMIRLSVAPYSNKSLKS